MRWDVDDAWDLALTSPVDDRRTNDSALPRSGFVAPVVSESPPLESAATGLPGGRYAVAADVTATGDVIAAFSTLWPLAPPACATPPWEPATARVVTWLL